MGEVIKNLYKAALFTCHHPAHKQFAYQVSPYHVFRVKKCHESGCVEFLWRCRTFEKGQSCPRGFKHVGRGCFSCKQYHEEKVSHFPETDLSDDQLREFIDSLRQYQGWLEEMDGKSVEFAGIIDFVTPHLMMNLEARRTSVIMDGYYISFDKGQLNRDFFDDRIYLKISGNFLERHRPSPGDKFDLTAYFTESRGRIILRKPTNIEIIHNGGKSDINRSRALVGRATGCIISGPIDDCKRCPFCSLVDIADSSRRQPALYRRFYCLRGVSESENCPVRLEKLLIGDSRVKN